MTNKLQALISKHRVLLEYNSVLPTNVVDVLIESFQDSLLEYARYVVPELTKDPKRNLSNMPEIRGFNMCRETIFDRISQDELSLGEEDTLNTKLLKDDDKICIKAMEEST